MSNLRTQCQKSLLTFLQALVPDFETTCHHEFLADLLQRTLTDSEVQKVSISCPPRIGKSSNTIRALVWAAGNSISSDAGLNHFVATYGLELSNQHKRVWNSTVNSEVFRAVFGSPEGLILPLFTSPAGVGTGIAAGSELSTSKYRGALVFDDMVKTLTRDPLPPSVAEWYTSVASTRRQKRWAAINIGTRFGLHDFTAMLRATEGEYHPVDNPDGYKFYNLPALVDGESFWPNSEHMSTRILTKLRDNPATSETFWVVYQGQPEYCLTKEEPIDPPEYDLDTHGTKIDTICSIDTSKGMSNPTAVLVLSLTDRGYWVLENYWELWGLQTVSTLKTALAKLRLPMRGIAESVGFGTALEYSQFTSNRSKRDRLMSVITTLQTRLVKAPGLDVERFCHQINDFGSAQYDDLADCVSQALIHYPKMPPPVAKTPNNGGLTLLTRLSAEPAKGQLGYPEQFLKTRYKSWQGTTT